jgi:ElaB/YqjD/DUF883 family membrane-anchored ribosome-binding protein
MSYETPDAVRHDAQKLAEEARALLEATAAITDQTVSAARERLSEALADGQQKFNSLREKASQGVHAADQTIRNNPYQSIAVAFGAGALLAYLITRRD